MTEKIKDGGPVYPNDVREYERYTNVYGEGMGRTITLSKGGISVRDYFAIHATADDLKQFQERDSDWHGASHPRHTTAVLRYKFADAMLKAREQ